MALMTFDIVIKNGLIIDGAGNPWFKSDIGITNGKIAEIGRLANVKAERLLDVKGLIVSPGFIDIHTHSDLSLLIDSHADSKIRQGKSWA